MHYSPEILGFAAAIFTSIAFLPQAIKTILTKDISGISLQMLMLQGIGNFLWVLYGLWIHSLSIVCANVITCLMVFSIVFVVVRCKFRGEV